jgi:tRNA threonylcarbamoyladenosine biosynthesis protein TsaB
MKKSKETPENQSLDIIFDFAEKSLKIGVVCGKNMAQTSLSLGKGVSATVPGILRHLLKQTRTNLQQLNRIILNQGPGSFTGIRVSFALAAGIKAITNCQIVAVPFHHAIAHARCCQLGAQSPLTITCAMNALRGEVFLHRYQFCDGNLQATGEFELYPLAELPQLIAECDCAIVDEAVDLPRQVNWLNTQLTISELLSAAEYFTPAEKAESRQMPSPIYLRKSAAREKRGL